MFLITETYLFGVRDYWLDRHSRRAASAVDGRRRCSSSELDTSRHGKSAKPWKRE